MSQKIKSIIFCMLIISIGFSILYYRGTQPMSYQILVLSDPIIDNKFRFRVENRKYERHYQFEMPENLDIKPGQQVVLSLLFEHTNDVVWGLDIGEKDVITAISVNGEKVWPESDLEKPIHMTRIK